MYEDAYNSDRDQRVEALVNAGDLTQAMDLLDTWHAQEPWNGEVLMRMAVVHWLAGEPARTLRDLDAYLAMDPDNAEALARRAQALLMIGKREDAEASLTRAEALDPHTPGVLLNRALISEEHDDYEGAIASLNAYLDAIPHDHLALARRSHLHRQLGHYPQALADALACVQMHPEDPEAHFAEALARVTLEQGEEALAACERCNQLRESFLPALRLRIDLLADLGRLDEAEEALGHLLIRDPTSSQTALLQARLATERRQFPAALEWVTRYLDDNPDEPYGYYRRGMVYFRMGDCATALDDFREYARLAPRAVEAQEQQFMCYLELQQYTQAAEVGRIAVGLQPQSFRLHYNLAYAELLCGHLTQADAGFQTALRLAPDNEELLLRIYLALAEHAPPGFRLKWFDRAVTQTAAPDPMLTGLLAEAHLEHGHYETTLQLAREVLATDRSRPFSYLLGVKALCLLDRYDEAMALADEGVISLPLDGRVKVARAMVLRDTNRPQEALRELDEAEQLLPGDVDILRQRALVYGSLGEIDEAIRLLEAAVVAEPDNADTHFWLGYFNVHQHRFGDALAHAERILTGAPRSTEAQLIRGLALRGLGQHRQADEALAWVAGTDPALLARLRMDPVIAALIDAPAHVGLGEVVVQSLRQSWQNICHLLHTGRYRSEH